MYICTYKHVVIYISVYLLPHAEDISSMRSQRLFVRLKLASLLPALYPFFLYLSPRHRVKSHQASLLHHAACQIRQFMGVCLCVGFKGQTRGRSGRDTESGVRS